jgi:hypothetical protein
MASILISYSDSKISRSAVKDNLNPHFLFAVIAGDSYNGHFESTCYHPLLLFNGKGDCVASKVRPGNVRSAEDCEELLLSEVNRQQKQGAS